MSFRDIRASRASRKPKSYIVPTAAPRAEEQETQETSQNQIVESASGHVQNKVFSSPLSSVDSEQDPRLLIPSGWYAELPPLLSIRRTKERGRGLWTSVGISAGAVLFSVKPHVHVLSRSQLDVFCTSCCAPQLSTGLKKCTKCRTIYYCNTTCQNADWPLHKLECEALQKWAASAPVEIEGAKYAVPPEAVRCLARIMWRRRKLGSSSIWWKEINEMQSNRGGIAQSMVDAHVHLAHALVRYMGISGQEELEAYDIYSIPELVGLISKFTSNSFTLTTPSLSPIGVSVSPLAALINHSCDPNVAVVFPRSSQQEPTLQVVAIQDIPAGSELFTSYIDITLPTAQRQKDLTETYNFTCACAVCTPLSGQTVEDWRERMWCPKKCGGSCPIPVGDEDVVRCSKCHSTSANIGDILDLLRVGQEALDKATNFQFSNPEAALHLTKNMVPLLSEGLPPSAHPLLALLRLHQSLLIASLPQDATLAQLDETVHITTASVTGLSRILRSGHPVRAIALAELGKLLAVDEPASSSVPTPVTRGAVPPETVKGELKIPAPRGPARLQRALQTLQQAYAELCVAFGRASGGGEVGQSVREMLVGLEKELGVWRSGIRDALGDALAERRGKDASRSSLTLPVGES